MMVNVVALVDLTHALLPGMLERGSGAVLNVGSTAGYQPSPYFAVYSATKAFVLNFSLALRQEYRGRGIRVTALCPGPVETGFFDAIGTRKAAVTAPSPPRNRSYAPPCAPSTATAPTSPRGSATPWAPT